MFVRWYLTVASVCLLSSMFLELTPSSQAASLRITEIWPGGLPGDELTSDWIEITNFGLSPITNLADFHYRDAPVPEDVPDGLPLRGGQLTGVNTLQPNESAVFLIAWQNPLGTLGSPIINPTLQEAINAFRAMWDPQGGRITLGYMLDEDGTGGPGLSDGGDEVILYDGSLTGSAVVDQQSYPVSNRASYIFNPSTNSFGQLAEDGILSAREGLLPASDQITAGKPPIGSPGVVVPEPGGITLITLTGVILASRRLHSLRINRVG